MPRYSLNAPAPPTPRAQPATQAWPAASPWDRTAAFLWDALPFVVLFQLLASTFLPPPPALGILLDPMSVTGPLPSPEALLADLLRYAWQLTVLAAMVWCGYVVWHVAFEACQGTTPGKWAVGLRVAPFTPGTPTFDQSGLGWRLTAFRFAASWLSWLTLNIGHAIAWRRRDRAMLHDLVSKTQVIEDPEVVLCGWILSPPYHRVARMTAWIILILVCVLHIVFFVLQVRALVDSVSM